MDLGQIDEGDKLFKVFKNGEEVTFEKDIILKYDRKVTKF